MASRPMVILDLDRTLFDTDRFYADLLGIVGQRYRIDPKDFSDGYERYHPSDSSGLRHYNFFQQLRDKQLDVDSVERLAVRELRRSCYIYDDVASFLNFLERQSAETLVLTFGEERFQTLKYHCVPELRTLRLVTTLEPKSRFINDNYPERSGIIIDDRQVEDLPKHFQHLWLRREVRQSPGGYHSLRQIQAAWPRLKPRLTK